MNEEVFKQLIREKKQFILPVLLFFLLFYFSLPFAIWLFPNLISLERSVFFMPWWWLYTFLQIILTWIFGWLYWRKSLHLDKLIVQMQKRD